MPQSKRRAGSTRLSNSFPNQIHIWARDARNMKDEIKMSEDKAVIKFSFNSVPVEFHMNVTDASSTNVAEQVKVVINEFMKAGFSAPVSWNKTGEDMLGKYGQVVKIEAADKMFAITAKLDGVEKEFVWKAFTATEFRKGDYIKVVKNDRGYKAGQLVTEDEYTGQKKLAESENAGS